MRALSVVGGTHAGCEQLLAAAASGVGLTRALAALVALEGSPAPSVASCRDVMGRTATVLAVRCTSAQGESGCGLLPAVM